MNINESKIHAETEYEPQSCLTSKRKSTEISISSFRFPPALIIIIIIIIALAVGAWLTPEHY